MFSCYLSVQDPELKTKIESQNSDQGVGPDRVSPVWVSPQHSLFNSQLNDSGSGDGGNLYRAGKLLLKRGE
jgi:hypothetical protein